MTFEIRILLIKTPRMSQKTTIMMITHEVTKPAPKKAPAALNAINTMAKQARGANPGMTQQQAVSQASALYRKAGQKK